MGKLSKRVGRLSRLFKTPGGFQLVLIGRPSVRPTGNPWQYYTTGVRFHPLGPSLSSVRGRRPQRNKKKKPFKRPFIITAYLQRASVRRNRPARQTHPARFCRNYCPVEYTGARACVRACGYLDVIARGFVRPSAGVNSVTLRRRTKPG